ncbi:MAG: hypothetical protein JOY85_09390 [Acidobacteriaceae bacterium]|nr:hypothetical protein [Acidobacteriaceae bacterium]
MPVAVPAESAGDDSEIAGTGIAGGIAEVRRVGEVVELSPKFQSNSFPNGNVLNKEKS